MEYNIIIKYRREVLTRSDRMQIVWIPNHMHEERRGGGGERRGRIHY